jgi:plastocyanin domain-containing protein
LQKGIPFKIRFNPVQLDGCNDEVVFPTLQGSLNLQQGQTETPSLTADQDFTFECGMGMLQGYAKVVDDIHNVNLQEIQNEIGN